MPDGSFFILFPLFECRLCGLFSFPFNPMFFLDFLQRGPSLPPPASPHRPRRPPLTPSIVPSSRAFYSTPHVILGIFEELFTFCIFPPEPFLEKPSDFLFFRRFSERGGLGEAGVLPLLRRTGPHHRETRDASHNPRPRADRPLPILTPPSCLAFVRGVSNTPPPSAPFFSPPLPSRFHLDGEGRECSRERNGENI